MAKFTVTIETPTRHRPKSRAEDIRERAALQSALLQIVGAVSNCGSYNGTVSGGTATGEFTYHCDEE
jgi:hypothetical protein